MDTPDGTPIRDYIDVEDLIKAHFAAYEYLVNGGQSDVFNLGNGTGFSVKQIVEMVEKVCETSIEKNEVPKREGESAQVYAQPAKAQEKLEWKSEKTLEQSIVSLKKWYQKKPNGYSR
jgi:UDP-glucose 4-epimerase